MEDRVRSYKEEMCKYCKRSKCLEDIETVIEEIGERQYTVTKCKNYETDIKIEKNGIMLLGNYENVIKWSKSEEKRKRFNKKRNGNRYGKNKDKILERYRKNRED